MKSERIKHRGAEARSGRFWRFAHEPYRRIRRQWRVYCLRPPVHFNCRCELSQRIKLVSSTSREVSQAMSEAGAAVHAAFSDIAKALSHVKIPPLNLPAQRRSASAVQIPGVLL